MLFGEKCTSSSHDYLLINLYMCRTQLKSVQYSMDAEFLKLRRHLLLFIKIHILHMHYENSFHEVATFD